MPSSHLILCHPLLLLPPIPPSIRVFSNESALRMKWPKYWSFSFSISPSKEIPGLISFRMDWLDLLAVQGTLKSLLQHHSSKASIFGAQPSSHPTQKRRIQNYCTSLCFSSAGPKARCAWIPWLTGGRVSALSPFGHARPGLAQLVLPPTPHPPPPLPGHAPFLGRLVNYNVLPLAHWLGERRFLSLEAESKLGFRIPHCILCSHHCLLNSFLV